MAKIIQSRIYRSFLAEKSEDPNVLKGVIICEVGEAKGHGYYLGEKFLDQVVQIATRKGAVKVRLDHPEQGKSGKVLSIIGQAFNFRRDGDKVRADVKLFDLPDKDQIKKLAEQASDLFGMSLDFVAKEGKETKEGLIEIFCKDIGAVDFVESPAATNSLFSEKDEVDSEKESESQPNSKTNFMDKETLAALGLEEGASEKEIKAAILAACEAKQKMAEGDDKKDDDKDGEKDEEMGEGDKDKDGEENKDKEVKASAKSKSVQFDEKRIAQIIEKQVALQFTALTQKIGGKPIVNKAPASDDGKVEFNEANNFGFNAEEVAFAAKNKIPLKEWRTTLSEATSKGIRL